MPHPLLRLAGPLTAWLSRLVVVLTCAFAVAHVSGIIQWDWRWIALPAAAAGAIWVVCVAGLLLTIWIMVRIGKNIP